MKCVKVLIKVDSEMTLFLELVYKGFIAAAISMFKDKKEYHNKSISEEHQ